MNKNKNTIGSFLTREKYKTVKKFDRQEMETFCQSIYMSGYEDGSKAGKASVPGIDVGKIFEIVSQTKGIGPKRLEEIRANIEAAFGGIQNE